VDKIWTVKGTKKNVYGHLTVHQSMENIDVLFECISNLLEEHLPLYLHFSNTQQNACSGNLVDNDFGKTNSAYD
jgi:hypothetical protein